MTPQIAQGLKKLIEAANEADHIGNADAAILIDALVNTIVEATSSKRTVVAAAETAGPGEPQAKQGGYLSRHMGELGRGLELASNAAGGGAVAGVGAGLGSLLQGKGLIGSAVSAGTHGLGGGIVGKVKDGVELVLDALKPLISKIPALGQLTGVIKSIVPAIATLVGGGALASKMLGGSQAAPGMVTQSSTIKKFVKLSDTGRYHKDEWLVFENDGQIAMLPGSMLQMLRKF